MSRPKKFDPVIRLHLPTGYELKERSLPKISGQAVFQRDITCDPITDRHTLYVFLHECGHVHSRHLRKKTKLPKWQLEYEADQYAITAMRTAGVAIPRATLKESKALLRDAIEESKEHCDDAAVLKWAYGARWRNHA